MNSFYYPELSVSEDIIELQGDEARHIAASRRLKAGDQLNLFNGHGLVARAAISKISRQFLTLTVDEIQQIKTPDPRIILATAIPKADRINTLLDMATQLGMTDFVPLICDRSITNFSENKVQRYNRICINACKQSQRFFVPRIQTRETLTSLLYKHHDSSSKIIVADPLGQSMAEIDSLTNCHEMILVIGPEGGFSESEQASFGENNVTTVKLSDAILRIETACIALLSQIKHRQYC